MAAYLTKKHQGLKHKYHKIEEIIKVLKEGIVKIHSNKWVFILSTFKTKANLFSIFELIRCDCVHVASEIRTLSKQLQPLDEPEKSPVTEEPPVSKPAAHPHFSLKPKKNSPTNCPLPGAPKAPGNKPKPKSAKKNATAVSKFVAGPPILPPSLGNMSLLPQIPVNIARQLPTSPIKPKKSAKKAPADQQSSSMTTYVDPLEIVQSEMVDLEGESDTISLNSSTMEDHSAREMDSFYSMGDENYGTPGGKNPQIPFCVAQQVGTSKNLNCLITPW